MRTQRELYTKKTVLYDFELEKCPQCGEPLTIAYTSGWKTVQTMSEVIAIAQRPKRCTNMKCAGGKVLLKSVLWQQIAPIWCTYGYDVIAQIGWQRQIQRQTFSEVHLDLQANVCISETQVQAVDKVSFTVRNGETLGLVGESGCGKTTVGRSILRLIEPTSGEVTFDGENMITMRSGSLKAMRRNMQIIFQDQ